jgi:hypothetical protein
MRGSCMLVASVIGILLATAGVAAPVCSPKDAEAADAAVDSLNSWQTVQVWHRKYASFDDGSMAEGSSEAIATFRRKIRTACSGARIGRNAEICKAVRIWVDGECRH